MSPPVAARFYIPGLDGIRGMAVLLVFLYHGQVVPMVPGGLGTASFFFLSGFLITTLFVREWRSTGRINLKGFYARRALRLLPLLYLVLGLAAGAHFLLGVGQPLEFWHTAGNFLQFTNYSLAITQEHYGCLPGMILLWSLAVDEHFYLVFAPAFRAAVARISLDRIAKVVLGLCVLVLAWRCWIVWSEGHSMRLVMSTDTRIDAILWGCYLALWRNPALDRDRAEPLTRPWLVALAFAGLLVPFATRSWDFKETIGFTIEGVCFIPIFCAAILHGRSGLFSILEWKPLKWIGRISYPLFLLQWLMIEICYEYAPGPLKLRFLCAVLGTFLLAIPLHYGIERPLARLRRRTRVAADPASLEPAA